MITAVDKLAGGIRLRQQRTVESALRDGANPNCEIKLNGDEQFGVSQAPVIYLAIHYDMPETVQLLVRMGARVHQGIAAGLTPRAHAAWRFRWECVDIFDETGQVMLDDETVLSVISTHWSEPKADPSLEDVFFHRLDMVAPTFCMTPDLAISVVVSVLCGWDGYRVAQLRRLLSHVCLKDIGKKLQPALYTSPERFAPHYAKMHRQVQKFAGEQAMPDTALELMAEFDIPIAPPPGSYVNAEACAWLEEQQARVDSIMCRQSLTDTTVQVSGQGGRGRL